MNPEPVQSLPRPRSLTLVGWLFILSGISAAVGMVVGFSLNHGKELNSAVLMLPVGIGLLRGRSSSIWWAKFWIGLWMVCCGVALVLLVIGAFDRNPIQVVWFGTKIEVKDRLSYLITLAMPCLYIAISLACWRVLSSLRTHQFMLSRDETFGR